MTTVNSIAEMQRPLLEVIWKRDSRLRRVELMDINRQNSKMTIVALFEFQQNYCCNIQTVCWTSS